MNWYKKAKIILSRTLYHGTTIDNMPSIKSIGLIGGDFEDESSFVVDAYSRDYEEMWEELKKEDVTIPVFMTDKGDLSKAIGAMMHHVGKKLGKGYHDVTDNDIRNHGLLVIIKDTENDYEQAGEEIEGYEREGYFGLEPYDYYADRVFSDGFLYGNKLITFLNKMGVNITPDEKTKNRLEGWQKGKEIATEKKRQETEKRERERYPLFQ